MSSEHAIVTVTRTLRNILVKEIPTKMGTAADDAVQNFDVTTYPIHKVRDLNKTDNLINLFLYRTEVSAAWRNMPLPTTSKGTDDAQPPLALNLEYLVTAYGEADKEDLAHFYLGAAMRVLHDCTIVPRAKLSLEVEGKGHVHDQIENIRVTPRPLSIEEMSKLWATFQTNYRVSAAYLVTVLLIDSRTPSKSGPPVLKRGPKDTGPFMITTPPPSLVRAIPATDFAAVRLGDPSGEDLILSGQYLSGGTAVAIIRHPSFVKPLELPANVSSAEKATLTIPASLAGSKVASTWPAGVYTVSLVVTKPSQPKWTTNEVPFALAPRIKVSPLTNNTPNVKFELTIESIPQVRKSQSVFVLWDDLQIVPKPIPAPANDDAPSVIKADVKGDKGFHRVRLRVDGIDSIPVVKVSDIFEFDPKQSVEVQ
jgi:hypothetical protein